MDIFHCSHLSEPMLEDQKVRLNKFSSRHSGKLKVVKNNVYCVFQNPSGFSSPVKELSSWQSGRVAELPNSPPSAREVLGSGCSCTIVTPRSVLRILIPFAVFLLSISLSISKNRC